MREFPADGIYSLTYVVDVAGQGATAHALAIVKDLAIIGSDAEGGMFEGRLFEDGTGGGLVFRGQFTGPPNGELLTGLAARGARLTLDLVATSQTQAGLRFVADVAGAQVNVLTLGRCRRHLATAAFP